MKSFQNLKKYIAPLPRNIPPDMELLKTRFHNNQRWSKRMHETIPISFQSLRLGKLKP